MSEVVVKVGAGVRERPVTNRPGGLKGTSKPSRKQKVTALVPVRRSRDCGEAVQR